MRKVLVIGSGPIIIGQAAEFDYSGTQACKVLKEEGLEVILVNSNPATIMTDTTYADAVYFEPLTVPFIEKIIEKERPDALLAGMGGQIALNLAVALSHEGVLERFGVELIGTNPKSIERAEDRDLFKKAMEAIGQPVIESYVAGDLATAKEAADRIGYPVVVRPAFTMGGTGGGFADDAEELLSVAGRGLAASPVSQVLIEKSIRGWKEIEYEMIRDGKGNAIAVCNMENVDPVGIHTGDSIVVAPSQTLSDREYQMLRKASLDIVEALEIIGGCNVQIALDPDSFQYYLIEVNPRVSRSSALASKATGYPIAKVATKIALGYGLDEITNDVTGKTMACFEPTLDYCVIKMPKWPFEKLGSEKRTLGTTMMATGEVMAIGNSFESALLKGIRSLEGTRSDLSMPGIDTLTREELIARIKLADDERLFLIAEALRRDFSVEELNELTTVDPFFLHKIQGLVAIEKEEIGRPWSGIDTDRLRYLKKVGFADETLARWYQTTASDVHARRKAMGILPVHKTVDTCAGEFEATSNYHYATYDLHDEVTVSDRKKVLVVGSGPIRIGQGVEFDYCSVHGVMALAELGYEALILNNNPETVSTDFDLSDKLYFDPITGEDLLGIVEKEKPEGVILQYGGQTAIRLVDFCEAEGIEILGTKAPAMRAAEDRATFDTILTQCEIPRPKGTSVVQTEEGITAAKDLGFPLVVRPSFVLGGEGMEIVYDELTLKSYLDKSFARAPGHTVLIDRYLTGLEIEIDGLYDGKTLLVPGITEHLERAGVHSGDSTAIYPATSLNDGLKETILSYTERLAEAIGIVGFLNIQMILAEGELYVIEVNPRASRTVPFLSKVTGVPMVSLATRIMLGEDLADMGYGSGLYPEKSFYAVKVPVFSMEKIPQTDTALGPEMKSTGEVLAIEKTRDLALQKGFLSAGVHLPPGGTVLYSVSDPTKEEAAIYARQLVDMGYRLLATAGTADYLKQQGIPAAVVDKIGGDHDVLAVIRKGMVDLVVNLPSKGKDATRDGFRIRRAALEKNLLCLTNLDTLRALLEIARLKIPESDLEVYSLQSLV